MCCFTDCSSRGSRRLALFDPHVHESIDRRDASIFRISRCWKRSAVAIKSRTPAAPALVRVVYNPSQKEISTA